MARQIHKGIEPCPKCGSSEAWAAYDDGSGYCFLSTCKHFQGKGKGAVSSSSDYTKHKVDKELIQDYSIVTLLDRGLTQETCDKFKYATAEDSFGNTIQIANYFKENRLIAQKLRYPNKKFEWIKRPDNPGLYGQWLWNPGQHGRKLVITEGEIDCLTVAQVQGLKYATVSLPDGAGGASKAIQANLEWIEQFEEVIFMLDSDEQGQDALHQCAKLITPGKAKVATLRLKDANEMLLAGRAKEIISAIFDAKEYRPDGVLTAADLKDEIDKPVAMGLSYPWPSLTRITYGIRPSELVALGAGTGMGKSELFKEIATHILIEHKLPVGLIFLEEKPSHTLLGLMGKIANKLFHIPGEAWTTEDKLVAFDKVDKSAGAFFYDSFGYTEWKAVKERIRYWAVAKGVKHIFIDHITAFVTGDPKTDERRELDSILTDMASLARSLDACIFLISHLATPEGKPHEEGGRVMTKHFRGSRAIGQWSSFVFGYERNQQEPDLNKRSIGLIRCLKDRYTGRGTGEVFYLKYDRATGRNLETTETIDLSSASNSDY